MWWGTRKKVSEEKKNEGDEKLERDGKVGEKRKISPPAHSSRTPHRPTRARTHVRSPQPEEV